MSITNEQGIVPKICPVCKTDTNYIYRVKEAEDVIAQWYRCTCGVIFQEDFPSHKNYDFDYLKKYAGAEHARLQCHHAARTYAPLIEELTYGRQLLDVGFGLPYNMEYFKERGWLVWGIDLNKDIEPGGAIYQGNFMTYDFQPNISDEKLEEIIGTKDIKRTFDVIWMNHVFEHFNDPIAALKRAYDLLSPTGVLFISTPDIDFINKQGVSGWSHWRKHEHYTLWSERALKREMERLNFKVVMSRKNFSQRYISWWDVHMIAQKKYF